jgi:hypothetical protein
MLAAHRARVLRTISEWQSALALLDSKIRFYDDWQRSGKRPAVEPSNPMYTTRNKPT